MTDRGEELALLEHHARDAVGHPVERASEIPHLLGDPSPRQVVDTGARPEIARAELLRGRGDVLERTGEVHRYAPRDRAEDDERSQQRDDDAPRLRGLRPRPKLERADDLAAPHDGHVSDALLEDDASRSSSPAGIREETRIAPDADIEPRRLAQLAHVGVGRRRIVPEPAHALLHVTRHHARRVFAAVAAREHRRQDARADGEEDRGQEPEEEPSLQPANAPTSRPERSPPRPHDGLART